MSRHGFVIGVRPEKLDQYKRLHRAVWPEILELLRQAHVSNYTMFQKDDLLSVSSTMATPIWMPTSPP